MARSASETPVVRFVLRERLTHWGVAGAFSYTALTGLALWAPALYGWAGALGGGEAVRAGHPWGGLVFGCLLFVMTTAWARSMWLDRDDWQWLKRARDYATHRDEGLPEAGRFNAGQKLLFWSQLGGAAVLVASGLVLWWPSTMPRTLRVAAILLHPVAGIVGILGIMVHIYMATAATPGSFRAMVSGSVSHRWAASHHAKWNREISKS